MAAFYGSDARGPDLQLPWSSTRAEDARFQQVIAIALLLLLLLAIAIPLIKLPEIPREQQEALPEQLARVILEKQELPKPEPLIPEPEPEIVPPQPPKPQEPPKPPEPAREVLPRQVDLVQEAREKAAVSGLLAFQDDLQDMRQSIDVQGVTRSNLNRGRAEAERLERSVITAQTTNASEGIQTSNLSRDTGGVALSGRETTRIESPLDAAGGRGTSPRASNPEQVIGGRSDESIRRVMDANKGVVFGIYNRALRTNPALQGRLVFEMIIEPSGVVSAVRLVSSELGDPELESRILTRIRLIDFGAVQAATTRVNYSLDFLPY